MQSGTGGGKGGFQFLRGYSCLCGVDSASYAVIFLPLLPTTPRKAKMTVIFQNAKNGCKKTGNLFLISCFNVPLCIYGCYSILNWLQFYNPKFVCLFFNLHSHSFTIVSKWHYLKSTTLIKFLHTSN